MNDIRVKILIYFLMITESIMIIYSYYISISYFSLCIGGIYLLTAISDYWSKDNLYITRILLFLSLIISIPRLFIQIEDIIIQEKISRLSALETIPKPIWREVNIALFDCSRIPYWQGELQMKCNTSNLEQRKEQNENETHYTKELSAYSLDIQKRRENINHSGFSLLSIKSISLMILYLLITPTLPLLVIFLVHKDTDYIGKVLRIERNTVKNVYFKPQKNKKQIAQRLLLSGVNILEVKEEIGVSTATIYRWKKNMEYTRI